VLAATRTVLWAGAGGGVSTVGRGAEFDPAAPALFARTRRRLAAVVGSPTPTVEQHFLAGDYLGLDEVVG
jgi:hypothetical protein